MSRRDRDIDVNGINAQARAEIRALEADIRRTYARLEARVAELGGNEGFTGAHRRAQHEKQGASSRLQEESMAKVEAKSYGEHSEETGPNLVSIIREHPFPAALIGAGIALLAVGSGVGVRERQHADDESFDAYSERYGYNEGRYGEDDYDAYAGQSRGRGEASQFESYAAYDSGYDTGERDAYKGHESYPTTWAEDSDEGLQQRAREAGKRVQHAAERTERGVTGFIEDQPLVAGLITLIFGALIGILFPSTKKENELLGGAREQFGEQARDVAARARNVAQRTFEEARDSAREEFAKLSSEAKEDGKDLLEKGKQAAKTVGERAREAARQDADTSV